MGEISVTLPAVNEREMLCITSSNYFWLTKQTRGIHSMLFQCWASVEDAGPTLKRHWVNASCLLGCDSKNSSIKVKMYRPDVSILQVGFC